MEETSFAIIFYSQPPPTLEKNMVPGWSLNEELNMVKPGQCTLGSTGIAQSSEVKLDCLSCIPCLCSPYPYLSACRNF